MNPEIINLIKQTYPEAFTKTVIDKRGLGYRGYHIPDLMDITNPEIIHLLAVSALSSRVPELTYGAVAGILDKVGAIGAGYISQTMAYRRNSLFYTILSQLTALGYTAPWSTFYTAYLMNILRACKVVDWDESHKSVTEMGYSPVVIEWVGDAYTPVMFKPSGSLADAMSMYGAVEKFMKGVKAAIDNTSYAYKDLQTSKCRQSTSDLVTTIVATASTVTDQLEKTKNDLVGDNRTVQKVIAYWLLNYNRWHAPAQIRNVLTAFIKYGNLMLGDFSDAELNAEPSLADIQTAATAASTLLGALSNHPFYEEVDTLAHFGKTFAATSIASQLPNSLFSDYKYVTWAGRNVINLNIAAYAVWQPADAQFKYADASVLNSDTTWMNQLFSALNGIINEKWIAGTNMKICGGSERVKVSFGNSPYPKTVSERIIKLVALAASEDVRVLSMVGSDDDKSPVCEYYIIKSVSTPGTAGLGEFSNNHEWETDAQKAAVYGLCHKSPAWMTGAETYVTHPLATTVILGNPEAKNGGLAQAYTEFKTSESVQNTFTELLDDVHQNDKGRVVGSQPTVTWKPYDMKADQIPDPIHTELSEVIKSARSCHNRTMIVELSEQSANNMKVLLADVIDVIGAVRTPNTRSMIKQMWATVYNAIPQQIKDKARSVSLGLRYADDGYIDDDLSLAEEAVVARNGVELAAAVCTRFGLIDLGKVLTAVSEAAFKDTEISTSDLVNV